jgi:fumarylacetoacetase
MSSSRSSSSWLEIPPESDFSLANIPFGVFSVGDSRPRCGTALADFVIDLSLLAEAGLFDDIFPEARHVFSNTNLNSFMQYPKPIWVAVRNQIILLLNGTNTDFESNVELRRAAIHSSDEVKMHLPATIGDYTDFYSSKNHAENVGTMFRGKDNALQPNWLHLPVGYHGRSSTVHVSGQAVRRPCGQLQKDPVDPKQGSLMSPCRQLDFELEVAFFVGGPENTGTSLSIDEANDRIFGFVLMNDWSARDIQKWEYVPLGPFTAKNFATSISPWIVTTMALEAFPTSPLVQEPVPLPYLQDADRKSSFDIQLFVSIQGDRMVAPVQVCQSNFSDLYWTAAQQLVHHSVTGCTMRPGDLLGSGTISSSTQGGSMLELSWKGTREVTLGDSGEVRKFLQDGDTVIMQGWTQGKDRVGFGSCVGKLIPVDAEKEETLTEEERYTDIKLYNYRVSSSSWRVRIALEAKSIPYENITVDLKEEQHLSDDYSGKINPMKQVPVLEFKDNGKTIRLSQSIAIVEFLEEAFPTKTPLLPVDPVDRAMARQMCQIVNSGIQPLQNIMYLRDLEERSGGKLNTTEEGQRRIHRGLVALEALVQQRLQEKGHSSIYSLGGFSPSLVDAVLIPQLFNAKTVYMMDIDTEFPTLARILQTCLLHPWFSKTHPSLQPESP